MTGARHAEHRTFAVHSRFKLQEQPVEESEVLAHAYAYRYWPDDSRRAGLLILVAGLHVLIIYGLMVATGVVRQPAFVAPIEAVFIPEATQTEPEPEIKMKPEIDQPVAAEQPMPEVQFDEAVMPPADCRCRLRRTRSRLAAAGAPAQDLKTAIASSRPIRRPRAARVSKARCA